MVILKKLYYKKPDIPSSLKPITAMGIAKIPSLSITLDLIHTEFCIFIIIDSTQLSI